MPRETVTLQLGDLSCLSAVHYWNSLATQWRLAKWANETILDFNLLFRDLVAHLCPRGILPFHRAPYPPERSSLRGPDVQRIWIRKCPNCTAYRGIEEVGPISAAASPEGPLKLGELKGEIESWHDYSFVKFDRRALCHLKEQVCMEDNSVDSFVFGLDLADDHTLLSRAEDAIRYMVEECDQLGDFHVIADAVGACGGLATSVIENVLMEEYGQKDVVTFANFRACDNFSFKPIRKEIPSLALSLSSLLTVSDQLYPLLLEQSPAPSNPAQRLFGEELSWSRVVDSSVMCGAILDAYSTAGLCGRPFVLDDSLAEVYFGAAEVGKPRECFSGSLLRPKPLATTGVTIQRINHSEGSYPSSLGPGDLPIYPPNFSYSGYQQQATSFTLGLDDESSDLSDWIQSNLVSRLRRQDFANLPDVSAQDCYRQVVENLASVSETNDD